MKNFLFFIILQHVTISTLSFGQTKRTKLLNEKIGAISLDYFKTTDIINEEITYHVLLSFQNSEYKSQTDTKIIILNDLVEYDKFKVDLSKFYKQMLLNEKVDINYVTPVYGFTIYDFSENLYLRSFFDVNFKNAKSGLELYDLDGNSYLRKYYKSAGYTTLSKKQVEELMVSINKIDFGNDVLLKVE